MTKTILKLKPIVVFLPVLAIIADKVFKLQDILLLTVTQRNYIGLILFVGLFIWYYAVGAGFVQNILQTEEVNLRKFKFWFIVLVISIIVLPFSLWHSISSGNKDFAIVVFGSAIMFIIAYFKILIVIAKSICIWENNKINVFGNSLLYLILLWFFPVGIWVIQDKANTMIKQSSALTSRSS